MKKLLTYIIATVLLPLGACNSKPEAKTLWIGVITPGSNQPYQQVAEQMADQFTDRGLGKQEVRDLMFRFARGSTPAEAGAQGVRLATVHQVSGMIIPGSAEQTAAVAKSTQGEKVLLISLAPNPGTGPRHCFYLGIPLETRAEIILKYFQDALKCQSFTAYTSSQDPASTLKLTALQAAAKKLNLKLSVASNEENPTETTGMIFCHTAFKMPANKGESKHPIAFLGDEIELEQLATTHPGLWGATCIDPEQWNSDGKAWLYGYQKMFGQAPSAEATLMRLAAEVLYETYRRSESKKPSDWLDQLNGQIKYVSLWSLAVEVLPNRTLLVPGRCRQLAKPS